MENNNENNRQEEQGTRTFREEFNVSGDRVVETIKNLLHEGNVRKIIIKNEEGKVLLEVPLTIGVVGTLLLPVWAAIGAVAALVANLTITVERRIEPGETPPAGAVESTPGQSTDVEL